MILLPDDSLVETSEAIGRAKIVRDTTRGSHDAGPPSRIVIAQVVDGGEEGLVVIPGHADTVHVELWGNGRLFLVIEPDAGVQEQRGPDGLVIVHTRRVITEGERYRGCESLREAVGVGRVLLTFRVEPGQFGGRAEGVIQLKGPIGRMLKVVVLGYGVVGDEPRQIRRG